MLNNFNIFSIQSEEDFNKKALEIFKFQYNNTLIYKKFVDLFNIDINGISHYTQIPFIPIEFYKTKKIIHQNYNSQLYFQSSGTTSMNLSKHYIADESIYQKSIINSFKLFFGDPSQYVFLGLLPSYLERENSSLIYMVNYLMQQSNHEENGYFLNNWEALNSLLKKLEKNNKKTILFGVSYALIDFSEKFPQTLKNSVIIETGGMKGRKEEITKEELLKKLQNSFHTSNIFSEYSMTELLSQAYSMGNNIYQTPPWMKVLIRDIEDPFHFYVDNNKSGGISIIDLANVYSCSFISTQDLGRQSDNNFEILGRMDNSDIRGCSLLLL
ncbi:long-chain-fatty-acid--protein ligase [Apibacter adventoris]|uniref:acyl transferase n=1 Tax=Apibacter adventoris TaxID=1679466 RepID=UPI000CF5E4E6|nr:acyl transferase [Apibacter adventoris]PQL93577.1 acyl transferase [Apibacter adventoris]